MGACDGVYTSRLGGGVCEGSHYDVPIKVLAGCPGERWQAAESGRGRLPSRESVTAFEDASTA